MGSPERLRSTVTEDEFGGFRITIPVTPKWSFRLFLPVWLCGWLVGEVVVLRIIFSGVEKGGELAFMIVWVCGWTVGGSLVVLSLAWNWFGREVVVIDSGWMETRHEIGWFSRSRSFELSRVRGLRYSPRPHNFFWMSMHISLRQWGLGPGTIAYDYDQGPTIGTTTHRFGQLLPESEARRIIQTIRQRFKFPEKPDVEPLPIQH